MSSGACVIHAVASAANTTPHATIRPSREGSCRARPRNASGVKIGINDGLDCELTAATATRDRAPRYARSNDCTSLAAHTLASGCVPSLWHCAAAGGRIGARHASRPDRRWYRRGATFQRSLSGSAAGPSLAAGQRGFAGPRPAASMADGTKCRNIASVSAVRVITGATRGMTPQSTNRE
jgi:hypothetical protein